MTFPLWFTLPPEVPAALLRSGPGVGPLLAASSTLLDLSSQYTAASQELLTTLADSAVQVWEGLSAEQFRAAHAPFLSWLAESAGTAAAAAAIHQTVASAYETAVAAMPTLLELSANHTLHALLTATNFLGINTIPLALNEADYLRMWMQAAATMTTYQAVMEASLAAMPTFPPAPVIVNPASAGFSSAAAAPMQAAALSNATQANALNNQTDGVTEQQPPSSFLSYFPFYDSSVEAVRDFLRSPSLNTLLALLVNVGLFSAYQAFFQPVGWGTWLSPLWAPLVALGGAGTALGIAIPLGATTLPQLSFTPQDSLPDRRDEQPSPPALHLVPPVVALPSSPGAAASTPPAHSALAPASPGAASSIAPSPHSPPQNPLTVSSAGSDGPPGAYFGPPFTLSVRSSTTTSTSVSSKRPLSSVTTASDSVQSKRGARARVRGRSVKMQAGERMRAYDVMDLPPDEAHPNPVEATQSHRASSLVGAAGATPEQTTAAAGFSTLPQNPSYTGMTIPMLPHTWTDDSDDTT